MGAVTNVRRSRKCPDDAGHHSDSKKRKVRTSGKVLKALKNPQMKTRWSDKRLHDLFQRYNRQYWRGELSEYRVTKARLSGIMAGHCVLKEKLIEIDVRKHSGDRQLRSTVLHEMAHAGAGTRGRGHGLKFFAQVERLLRMGAPITADSPEAGGAHILADIVPKRFRLLKATIERAEKRRQRAILEWERSVKVKSTTITDDMIVQEFEDVAMSALTWKQALLAIGLQHGLTDDTGRPVNAWAKRIVARGRNAHASARRSHLEDAKQAKMWASLPKSKRPEARASGLLRLKH